mgnify:FL=1
MTMKDWVTHVDNILAATDEDVLKDNGKISCEKMSGKVTTEYQKYQSQTLSQVEKDYLKEIKSIENLAKEGKAHE